MEGFSQTGGDKKVGKLNQREKKRGGEKFKVSRDGDEFKVV